MNIYVSNIPFRMKDEDLKSLFVEFGDVISAKIIMDRDTNRSRGFGFVEMPDEAASAAIEGLNGRDVMGLELRVNEARPRTESTGGNFRSNNRGGYNRRDN